MWNKCAMSTLAVGSDGGIYIMSNVYPKIGTTCLTKSYNYVFYEGPSGCQIDTIDFDHCGEIMIGSGPGICGFIYWDLNYGDCFNCCSGIEQNKILKFSTDSKYILTGFLKCQC